MTSELFRHIQQSFVLPAATDSIDVANEPEFQTELHGALSEQSTPDQLRALADSFLSRPFQAPTTDPFMLGKELDARARFRQLSGADAPRPLYFVY